MGQAASQLKSTISKVLEEVNQACLKVFYEVSTEAVSLSPIDKGLLINQWYPMQGGGFSSELNTSTSTSGLGSLSRISKMLGTKEFRAKDGVMTLVNNLDYAYNAEILGWKQPRWSGNIGPYAMVAQAVIITKEKFR